MKNLRRHKLVDQEMGSRNLVMSDGKRLHMPRSQLGFPHCISGTICQLLLGGKHLYVLVLPLFLGQALPKRIFLRTSPSEKVLSTMHFLNLHPILLLYLNGFHRAIETAVFYH